jgi:class 3 adenylate cyclase/ketosteroid isomerase-like protein/tetratricopeptide (TPR) repeat protein
VAKIYAPDPPPMRSTCAKCGNTNRDAARFCAGCGAPLALACAACGADLAPGARFCDACGAAVAPASARGREVRKTLTVVFADLAGSTALQEQLDPESARRVMTRFYDRMRGVLEAHGGRLEKLIGDAVLGVFGRPSVREDDALRAVRAAAAMVSALDALNEELDRTWGVRLRMRTGVNTGELVVGETGELVGDTMNIAARLEHAAAEGEVLVGEPTWRLVHHAVELEPITPLLVKGKSDPLAAWRLVSAEAVDRGHAGSIETPLVGREAELERLRAAFDGVLAARACRLMTVVGAPGVGKSRLAHELVLSLAERATVVEGHCEPTGEGITFLPVAEILRVIAGVGEADPAETVRDKLRLLTPADDPDRERLVEGVAGVLGISEPASAQETFWALRRGVEFLARERPLVLILDDLHWGQPMLLDLVEHLVEWVRDAPVLLVALARPELREEREALVSAGRRAVDVIELEPLDQQESLELVSHLLGDVRVPVALSARILETTEGNPLFLGETLRMLVDEGALRRDGDTWVAQTGIEAVEVPPTIQALLAARIERLRGDERMVVERASVIGKQFYRGAVAELVSPPVRLAIDGHLEALRRKDMVEPEGTYWIDEPVYRFHHVLIRDAAYRSLLKEARADLHERFAHWLEVKAGELVGEHEEVIAFHLEQAHEYRRQLGPLDERGRTLGESAAQRLQSAGRRALAREDLAAAANLLTRALEREAGGEAEILWDLCEALLSAGDTSVAVPLVSRFTQAAGENRAQRARADVLGAHLANLTGAAHIARTAESAAAAATALAQLGDRGGEAKGCQVAAQAYARLGQVAAVEEALDRALAAARAGDDRRRITAVLAGAPRAALWGPSPVVRASGRCLDIVRILRMTPGNRHVEAIALRCQAVLEAMRGRADAAREILAAGRTTLEELGLAFELHETAVHAGIVELLASDPGAAADHLRVARAGFEALGVASGAAQAAALLARALVEGGDSDSEALEQTHFAERHGGEDLKITITWCSARAEALARTGDHESALQFARRAVSLAEPTDALADKADASMALARVLQTAGMEAQAREAATAAGAWYAAKGHAIGVDCSARLSGEPVTPPPPSSPGRVEVLGDRPPERFYAELSRRWAVRDLDALLKLIDPDYVMVDHRVLGWDEAHGVDSLSDLVRSAFAVSRDNRLEIDEVLACNERVIAVRVGFRGHMIDGSGDFADLVGWVTVVEDGRALSTDQYDHDDDAAMLARFAELGGPATERFRAEFRVHFDAHDVEACIELTAEDWVQVDHRKVGWGRARGRDRARQLLRSLYAYAADLRFGSGEVLASDDRVIAERCDWRGTSSETGGEVEGSLGMVSVIESGRRISEDVYEPDDRQAMIARYTELGGGLSTLGDREPERWWARLGRVIAMREHEALPDLYDEQAYEFLDHRNLGWDPTGSRREALERIEAIWDGTTDVRLEVEDVLACDARVIALVITWHGAAKENSGGGQFSFPLCVVAVIESGRAVCWEQYEPEDRGMALARYAELAGQRAPLGPRAPERFHAEWVRRYDARDLDALLELYVEDWASVDHRRLGSEEIRGLDACRNLHESVLAVSPDMRLAYDEVLACDERVIAARAAWRGHLQDGGGEAESLMGLVTVVEGGREVRTDVYEYDDDLAMIARYAELGGGQGPLGDRPPERYLALWIQAHAARDMRGLAELTADPTVLDHRSLGWEQVLGEKHASSAVRSGWEVTAFFHLEVEEVLACEDCVIAARIAWRGSMLAGGGLFEIPSGLVAGVDSGLAVSWDLYEPDDREAMLGRFAELSGRREPAGRAPERLFTELERRFASRDPDSVLELYAEDYALIDHRALGWEEVRGRDAIGEVLRHSLATQPNVELEIDEVLACDDRVIVLCLTWRGRGVKAGELAYTVGQVNVVENGRWLSTENFEPEDRQAMIARFAELGGGQAALGDRPPERFWAEFCQRWATMDADRIAELYADDWVGIEHRQLGWEEMRGREAVRAYIASVLEDALDVRCEVEEVLACDERAIALIVTYGGSSTRIGRGTWQNGYGSVVLVDANQITRLERFEPDERDAMLACYFALGGTR